MKRCASRNLNTGINQPEPIGGTLYSLWNRRQAQHWAEHKQPFTRFIQH